MKLKEKVVFLIIWSFVMMFLGGIIAVTLLQGDKEDPAAIVIESVSLRAILSDIKTFNRVIGREEREFPTHYTIKTITDTIEIPPDTPFEDIPIEETSWRDSLPIEIYGETVWIYYIETITHQGPVFEREIALEAQDIPLPDKDPAFERYGSLGSKWMNDNRIKTDLQIGLKFKKRISISGEAGHYHDWFYGAGIRVWF